MPSHYLNQCWHIVNCTHRNKLQWNFNQNSYIFIQQNAFENVRKMLAILSRPQCVNTMECHCNIAHYLTVTHDRYPHRLTVRMSYHQTFDMRCIVVGNKIVDHSDVVVCSASTTSSFSTWHLVSINGLGTGNCKTSRESFQFWDLLWLLTEILWYAMFCDISLIWVLPLSLLWICYIKLRVLNFAFKLTCKKIGNFF